MYRGYLSLRGWLQAASGAGRLCNWRKLKRREFFLLDWVHELSVVLRAASLSVLTLRELLTTKNISHKQLLLSPDNHMSSLLEEEGRNQGMMGDQWSLQQVVEGEGSLLGHRNRQREIFSLSNTSSFYLIQSQK